MTKPHKKCECPLPYEKKEHDDRSHSMWSRDSKQQQQLEDFFGKFVCVFSFVYFYQRQQLQKCNAPNGTFHNFRESKCGNRRF